MSYAENIVFAIVLTVAVFLFVLSAFRLIRLISLGQPDERLKTGLGRRFISTIGHAFGQKCAWAEPFGINHFFLFWGFMLLLFANAEFVVNGLFPNVSLHLLGPTIYPILTVIFDVISLVVLICVAVALFRRLVVRPSHIDYKSLDAFIILGLVGGLMIAFYGMHGAEIATGETKPNFLMPISANIIAPLMVRVFGGSLPIAGRVFWWLHAIIFLSFLNYLPYSKHMHILTSIPNCFCRSFDFVSTVPREEYSIGKSYGVSIVDQFSWKDLLDFTSCTECGRCNANCPATNTNKPLNPRIMIHDGKVNLLTNGEKLRRGNRDKEILPLIGESEEIDGTIGVESIWACTTCGACMANCPVFIEHVPKIIKMRRHLVENLAKFPSELNILFEATEQRFNPWGMAPMDRVKWAKGLDIPVLSSGVNVDYLFFVGCAGSFDSRNKRVATSVVKALKAAQVSFGILGLEEKCCGDSLRRLGNEFVFEKLAKANVELLKKYNVKKVICYCPHCYSTLKNDYKQFGLDAQVFHSSEILNELLNQGQLKLSKKNEIGRVVFHDSCYLGRYNGLYEQPRRVVEKVTGNKPVEMDRILKKSFCCGAGGGRMWMEENPENRININRVREALSKKPDIIAVSCPYCMTMFEDGVKDEKVSDQVKVLDIAEIVAASIE